MNSLVTACLASASLHGSTELHGLANFRWGLKSGLDPILERYVSVMMVVGFHIIRKCNLLLYATRTTRVLYANIVEGRECLQSLFDRLRGRIEEGNLAPWGLSRRPFQPHMTLFKVCKFVRRRDVIRRCVHIPPE